MFQISFSFKMEKEFCWMISHKYPFLISSVFHKHDLAPRTHLVPSEHHTTLQLQCPGEVENYYFSIVQITEGINMLCKVTQQSSAEGLVASTLTIFLVLFPSDEKLSKTQSVSSHVPAEFLAQ